MVSLGTILVPVVIAGDGDKFFDGIEFMIFTNCPYRLVREGIPLILRALWPTSPPWGLFRHTLNLNSFAGNAYFLTHVPA